MHIDIILRVAIEDDKLDPNQSMPSNDMKQQDASYMKLKLTNQGQLYSNLTLNNEQVCLLHILSLFQQGFIFGYLQICLELCIKLRTVLPLGMFGALYSYIY